MANWVLTDRTSGLLYDLSVTGGMFNLSSSNNPTMREPIIADTLLPNTYWNVYVNGGMIGYNQVVANGTSDQIYMFDAVSNQWWLFQITEGMDNIIASNGPVGSHGFYPIEYYYKFLQGGEAVRYLIKVRGTKDIETWELGTVIGKKSIYKAGLYDVAGDKQYSGQRIDIATQGKKTYSIDKSVSISGNKKIDKNIKTNIQGGKSFPIKKQGAVSGKKDITSVLNALDITKPVSKILK